MLYGVKLGVSSGVAGVDSLSTYGLFLGADVVIPKPDLKSNFIDIPGTDGSLDASDSPQGFPVFRDIEIEFNLFSTLSDLELRNTRSQIAMAYHGKRIGVAFPDCDGYYYVGRLHIGDVEGYNTGRIPCRLVASPYKLKPSVTEVTKTITTSYSNVTLTNIGRAVAPTVITGQQTQVKVNNVVYLYNSEDKVWDEDVQNWLIPAGGGLSSAGSGGIYSSITVQARIYNSETGGNQVTFRYQEAIL